MNADKHGWQESQEDLLGGGNPLGDRRGRIWPQGAADETRMGSVHSRTMPERGRGVLLQAVGVT